MAGRRLFVGARVSVATANALAACCETLARRARDAGIELKWVAPASYHVTLKFLGWTAEDTIGAVRDALEQVCRGQAASRYRVARLGAFASLDKASVLWAGIEDGAALTEVARRVDAGMTALGFSPEARAYHPHVTLARIRETRAVRDVVLPLSEQMFSESRLDGVTLFESETKPTGSVYREIHRISFKPVEIAPERQMARLELRDETDETDDGWPRGHGQ